jgi:chemotaxis protein CheX
MSNSSSSAHTVDLPQVLDLTAAAPLTEQLLSLRGLDLSVDASRVARLGGQCLQVLLACAATWKADGAKLELVGESDAFVEALRQFGVSPAMLATRKQPQ